MILLPLPALTVQYGLVHQLRPMDGKFVKLKIYKKKTICIILCYLYVTAIKYIHYIIIG